MRLLIIANWFEPAVAAGGPVRSLANLVDSVSAVHDVEVLAHDRDLNAERPFPGLSGRTIQRGAARVTYVNKFDTMALRRSMKQLASGGSYDIVLLNSIWDPICRKAALAIMTGMLEAECVVLMPRGELSVAAMTIKRRKKQVLGPLVQQLYRRTVDVVAATSDEEAADAAAWLPKALVVRASNTPDTIAFAPRNDATRGAQQVRIVFISRVSEKKGLLEFLRGLALAQPLTAGTGANPSVTLDVFGVIEDDTYWQACQQIIDTLPPTITVNYRGVLDREHIEDELQTSDAMVLLTADENYGHVIAESLQAGTPVIVTAHTPWTAHIRGGGGWVVDDRNDPDEVAAVVELLVAAPEQERVQMRARARAAFEGFRSEQPGDPITEAAIAVGLHS